MKLRPEEIDLIVLKLATAWRTEHCELRVSEEKLKLRLHEIFVRELKVEDDLNKEVETMLDKYEGEFASGKLDRRKMFLMVKNQLVKERKIVL